MNLPIDSAAPEVETAPGLYLRTYPSQSHGYGVLAIQLARHVRSRGIPVSIYNLSRKDVRGEAPEDIRPLITTNRNPWNWEVLFAPPGYEPTKGSKTVFFTMWESTRLHYKWVERLNQARAVLVPSEWCHQTFNSCGVRSPLFHVPLGVDLGAFRPAKSPTDGPVVFGTSVRMSQGGMRKRPDIVVEAFQLAFPGETDVRLEIKCSKRCAIPNIKDDRVRILRRELSQRRMREWYWSLTAYVSGSCGEGFSFSNLEAMACARPVIATRFSGHSEYLDESVGYPVRYDLVPALGLYQDLGLWGEPDLWSLVDQMRRAYRDRDEASQKGIASAIRAQDFTWERTGEAFLAILHGLGAFSPDPIQENAPELVVPLPDGAHAATETLPEHKRILRPPPESRPPRRNSDLVVVGPPFEACGVGQYARQVAQALGVRFVPYGHMPEEDVVLLHHHRHYYETHRVFETIYALYAAGKEVILDVHDPGGLEDLVGFSNSVIYHSPDFVSEVKAFQNYHFIPMMSPVMPDGGQKLTTSSASRVIGWHGLWNLHKGCDLAITAVNELRFSGLDAGLIAVGAIHNIDQDSQYRSQLHLENCSMLVRAFSLEDVVGIRAGLASYADIRATLEPCDLFCLPYDSPWPGQSSAAATLMAFGKPLIVSDIPMFHDLSGAIKLHELTVADLTHAVRRLMESEQEYELAAESVKLMASCRRPNIAAQEYRDFVEKAIVS